MATVTLRPNAPQFESGGAVVGAATAHQALSDNSDGSYVSLTNSGSDFIVGLTTFVLPAGSIVRYVQVRARAQDAPSSAMIMETYVISGTGDNVSYTTMQGFPAAGFAELAGSAVAGAYLNQTAIDGMIVGFRRFGTGNLRVAELYVDLTYTTAPVVTAVLPSGPVTTTTSPTVTWTYAPDADGGPQSQYRVRVFTAAQFGAAGFNPDTSASTWESGEQFGSVGQLIVGPLPNTTSYRAYVQGGQMVGSIIQYSAWSFAAFSLAVAAPVVASVVASADSDNGRNRLVVTRGGAQPWTGLDVERSSDGGITWQAVRGATNVSPPGDVWIGYDYEAGNGVSVIYRARALQSVGPVAGAWTLSTAVAWASTGDWLKDLDRPALSRQVTVETQPSVVRSRARGVFRPVGRADPVIVSDVRQLIVGEMSLLTGTDAEADDLNALLGADVLLFQTRPGERFGSRYLAVGDVEEVRDGNVTNPSRTWLVPFIEVLPSVDTGVVVPGATWGDVVATYATWTVLLAAKPTWGDLI